ncbi:hypothetical protein P3L10_016775 [Capsicum annuum]
MASLSSSSPSSSSSTDSVENTLTALILYPNITLPPLIPSPISQKFTDFSTFTNFLNPFAQIPSSTSSSSIPLLPPPIPLRIINEDDFLNDRDDIPIAYLIPISFRSQVNKKPSVPAKDTKPNAFRAKSSKSSMSTPASKDSSSSTPPPTVKAFLSRVSPSSSTHSKKQVSKPIPSDSSDYDFNLDTNADLDPDFEVPAPSFHQDTPEDHRLYFQNQKLARGRVVSGYGDGAMQNLLEKLEFQGRSHLFLQGDLRRRFARSEVYEFCMNGVAIVTTKDIIGHVNYMMLPVSMKSADNSMQRLRNSLAEKQAEVEIAQVALEAAQAAHEKEKGILQAQIAFLNSLLEKERAENADVFRKLTSLIPSFSFT